MILRLGPDLEPVELVTGAAVGLIGPGAATVLERFCAEPEVALLLPDAQAPLHPGYRIAEQVAAAVGGTHRAARDRAIDLLELVGLPEPHLRAEARPAELTALDRQRGQLALALAGAPAGLAAHHPGLGLAPPDAAALLANLGRVRTRVDLTLVLVADPGQAARITDSVLYVDGHGRIREAGGRVGPQAAGPAPDPGPAGGAQASSSST